MSVDTSADKPWRCNDCGTKQELTTHNGKSFYSSSGWYRALLHPDGKPVHLDTACFDSYNDDWPDYIGTHETSAWQWGQFEGKGLWVLPADYFERRDAYRRLPRWKAVGDELALVTHDGRTLGRLTRYTGEARRTGVYQPRDADWGKLGEPMEYLLARRTVEARNGLGQPGTVQA